MPGLAGCPASTEAGRAMPSPNKVKGLPPKTSDLSETAEAIARGRELVKQAQRSAEKANQQIEETQATIQQSDRVLDRSQQLPSDMPDEQSALSVLIRATPVAALLDGCG